MAYLAQHPDSQIATRSLAQEGQKPTISHMLMLQGVARYLSYRPRMAQFFLHQSKINPFVMWSHQNLLEDKVLSHFVLDEANTVVLLAAVAMF